MLRRDLRLPRSPRKFIETIKNLMETLSLTAQQAMDALKVPEESREKYLEKI